MNGILNEGWDRNQVKECYERHVKDILEWYRMKMISDKIIINESDLDSYLSEIENFLEEYNI